MEIQKSSQPLKPNQCWRDAGAPTCLFPPPLNRRTGAPLPQHPFTTRQIAAPAMAPDRYQGNFCNLFPSCVLESILPPPIPVSFLFRIFSSRGCQNEDWINRGVLCRDVRRFFGKTARGAFSFFFIVISLLFSFEIHSQFSEGFFSFLLLLLFHSRNESADVSRKCESKGVFGEFSCIAYTFFFSKSF